MALALLVVLIALNAALNPARFVPQAWGTLLGLAAPLLCAAAAAMPALLGGRGGIDVSVGPLMGFVNAVVVQVMVQDFGATSPLAIVPAALGLGAIVGTLNGALAVAVRVQPIIATLGTYLVLSGLTVTILPAPIGGAPDWLKSLSGAWSALPYAAIVLAWVGITRTPFHSALLAIGSDDRAAFTAGVPVEAVRFLSYVLTGVFGAVAGLSLTALIGSGDPAVGPNFTLLAISAAALGGVSLAGGRGGLLAASLGALDIFLLQSALTYFNVSTFVLQIAYGLILVCSVSLNALPGAARRAT